MFAIILWANASNAFEEGQNVYLNACGSDPNEYFNSPLTINQIIERSKKYKIDKIRSK